MPLVIKLELLVAVAAFALWVYCLVDVISADDARIHHLPKLGWLVLVLLFPLVGSIAWLVAGRPDGARAGGPRHAPAAYPEYERPGRMAPADPAADEAFLRQVRARAEEQRRRYEEDRREAQRREEADRERRRRGREGRTDEDAAEDAAE